MLKRCGLLWGLSVVVVAAGALLLPGRGGSAQARSSASEIRLADLRGEREKAVLDYSSRGCFGGSAFRLEYAPTPMPHVAVTDLGWGGSASKRLGTVTLTAEQVRRLDRTLRFFREQKGRGGCTTGDTLAVTVYRRGTKVATETHEDDTCSRGLLEDANPEDLRVLRQYPRSILIWRPLAPDATPLLSLDAIVVQARKAGVTTPYVEPPREKTEAYRTLQGARKEVAEQRRAEQMVLALPGYVQMRRQFRVGEVGLATYYPHGYSLSASLSATAPRLVDTLYWYDPMVGEKPRYDWNGALQVHVRVEKAVAHHGWVRQWKNAGPDRSICSHIFGIKTITEDQPERYVYPAWRHAGLKGLPRYQVSLDRDHDGDITVFFGDQEARALVLSAEPAKKRSRKVQPVLWLDTLKLSYHPTEAVPEYVVVTPGGVWKRNTRRDEKTPAWFQKN